MSVSEALESVLVDKNNSPIYVKLDIYLKWKKLDSILYKIALKEYFQGPPISNSNNIYLFLPTLNLFFILY